ncbi:MAG: hypothetical protein Q4E45_02410 [Eubacteriales bacterium]|nr:hypothetical protein [Eubacteriales bacterium]
MNDKNQELLRKLKALADRGVGGEKENARRILQELLDKYNIAEADLDDDILEEHTFRACGARERTLLIQTCFRVTNGDRQVYSYQNGKGSRSEICCNCTKAEAVRIGFEFDFFRELWKDEEKMFFLAFIQKHRIFSDKPGEGMELDPGELARMVRMMGVMQDKNPLLRLEGG